MSPGPPPPPRNPAGPPPPPRNPVGPRPPAPNPVGTRDPGVTPVDAGAETPNPWRGAGPELLTAAVAVTAIGLAAVAVAGWTGLVITAAGAAALSLVVVRGLAPRSAEHAVRTTRSRPSARALSGYGQRRFVVAMGVRDLSFYESDLRPALEHLLAARLAERHGVNLYTEPDAARKAFCRTPADEALWRWIDPERERQPGRAAAESGIPRRVLTRIVDRLEHL